MMKVKTYTMVAAIIFSLITFVHLLRVLIGWEGVIGGWQIPMWLSWLAVIIAGAMAYKGFQLSRKS